MKILFRFIEPSESNRNHICIAEFDGIFNLQCERESMTAEGIDKEQAQAKCIENIYYEIRKAIKGGLDEA